LYEANRYHTVCMLAGGTGITPMLQVIQAVASANGADSTRVVLLFSNKHADSIVEHPLLEEYAAKHSFLQVHYFVTADSADAVSKLRCSQMGRITQTTVATLCPTPSEDVLLLCCGPLAFNKSMRDAAFALGHDRRSFHKF
jgi:cytochrome-b5 reductase